MFTKEMEILNIIEKYPSTEEIFRSYDEIAGKCTMCHNLFDTLEEFANSYDISLNDLITKLNRAIHETILK